ncbi:hypothetical protein [uncultured Mucilaginibacter sp.]|nr:hypothetical protein [uncultured Mucilaginibacter sp.]
MKKSQDFYLSISKFPNVKKVGDELPSLKDEKELGLLPFHLQIFKS